MYLSVFMGPVALGEAQDKPQIDLCIDQAIRAADAGFAMVTFGEQHFNNYEPYSNPFLMGARLAPHLGETWFGTTIVPLPYHHPLRLAEDSNIIDLLTQGRFLMGISQGRVAFSPDFENFGLDPARRTEIFDSKLDYLLRAQRQKFGDEPLVMDSEWDKGKLLGRMMPVSWRKGGAQIAIGTNTPETIDSVAERGWPLFLGPTPPAGAAALLARHRAKMVEFGHSAAVQADAARKSLVTRHVFVGSTDEEAWEFAETMAGSAPMMNRVDDPRTMREMGAVPDEALRDGTEKFPANVIFVKSWITAGNPESVIRQLRSYADLGIEHLNIRFNVGPYNKAIADASMNRFIEHVLPYVDNQRFAALTDDEIDPVHLGATSGGFARPGALDEQARR